MPAAARRPPDDLPLAELGLPAELVTGEAVALDLRPASFATRALALALDLLVMAAIGIGLALIAGAASLLLDPAGASAVVLLVVVALLVGYPATLETFTRGRSVGKLVAGLRVVRDDGGPVRFRQALIRALIAVPELYATSGSVAAITSLANPRGKRLGDVLAGTYVVRERTGVVLEPPVSMPPELAGWAAGVDLGRIPDPLALAARSFLDRAGGLHPASRTRLATQLADAVAIHVAPPPPPGTYPERYLAAVLAERRARALARLAETERQRAARSSRRRAASPVSTGSTSLIGDQYR